MVKLLDRMSITVKDWVAKARTPKFKKKFGKMQKAFQEGIFDDMPKGKNPFKEYKF